MSFAPQQDWSTYRALAKDADIADARKLSIAQRFVLYEDLFRLVTSGQPSPINCERQQRLRWENKLALRVKLCSAFGAMDR